MRRQRARLIFCIGCLLAVVGTGVTAAGPQSRPPKTVVDYFLMVPEKFFPYDLSFRRELLQSGHRGAIIDIPNGYISWDASDAPDAFELAIFRKRNGKHVLVYSDLGDDFDDPEAGAGLILLTYEGGTWRDVTKVLLPVPLHKNLTYKLPRHSKSIEVTDEEGRALYSLTWANDRFHRSQPK